MSLQYGSAGQDQHAVREVIYNTQDMIVSLLKKFYNKTRQKPQKLIYYRDGVSEGQFEEILNLEVTAIQKACRSLQVNYNDIVMRRMIIGTFFCFQDDYEPGVTFVVAQKRHKTRMFPRNPNEGCGRMKKCNARTVIDTQITNPTERNFFLCSHEGIQVRQTKPMNDLIQKLFLWNRAHRSRPPTTFCGMIITSLTTRSKN